MILELVTDIDRQFVFRIHQATRQADEKDIKVAAVSKDDLSEWYNSLTEWTKVATDKVFLLIYVL